MSSKQNLAVTAAALGGLLAVGGASYAFADGSTSPAPSPSASASAPAASTPGSAPDHRGHHRHHTPVSSTVEAAVKAAVSARYSGVTIHDVHQAPDGSYEAFGTKGDGTRVHYDVSSNYRTITVDTRGPGGHGPRGGEHRAPGKAVTGTAAIRVKAAIVAKHPGFTVNDVRQDADGSYRARGTKGSTRAFFTVSKDLSTITEHTGRLHDGAPHQHGPSASATPKA